MIRVLVEAPLNIRGEVDWHFPALIRSPGTKPSKQVLASHEIKMMGDKRSVYFDAEYIGGRWELLSRK